MLDFSQDRMEELTPRFYLGYGLITILFVFVLFRLFYLQVVKGDFFWILSSEHTVKEIRIPAPRGHVLDRKGRVIVENRASFDLAVISQYLRQRRRVESSLEKVASLDPGSYRERWKWQKKLPPFYPLTLLTDLPYDVAARIRVAKVTGMGPPDPVDLRGVEILARPLRRYPHGSLLASTMGYLGEVSEQELVRLQEEEPGRYFLGDLVGAAGLERYWEGLLRGRDGFVQKVVDASGREVSSEEVKELLKDIPSEPGSDLKLTIDLDLQEFAETQFKERSGSLVAIDPRNGEVLALLSLPSYDPSWLQVNVDPGFWQGLLTDPRKPFLHRALQGYPPGSTFKIVTALAALEEKEIRPEETIYCPGGMRFGNRFFRCWREGGHGSVNLHRALVESCDTFFYQMGIRLGVDRLARYARLLGLGQLTGIDLGEEKAGLIPSSEWKEREFGKTWGTGETLSVAVGQGAVLVTPLQAAMLIAEVANGGRGLRPHLLKEVITPERRLPQVESDALKDLEEEIAIADEGLERVRAALVGVVNEPGGTAFGSRSKVVTFGGKTGTAQVVSEEGRVRLGGGGAHLKDHAWFVAFAPADEPLIALAVLVEHGGFGASAAAPIAKAVIEKYLEILEKERRDKEADG